MSSVRTIDPDTASSSSKQTIIPDTTSSSNEETIDSDTSLSSSAQTIDLDTASSSSARAVEPDVTPSPDEEIEESDVDSTEPQLRNVSSDVSLIFGDAGDVLSALIGSLYGANNTNDRICSHTDMLLMTTKGLASYDCSPQISFSPTTDIISVKYYLFGFWNESMDLLEIGDLLNEAVETERYSSFYEQYVDDGIISYFGFERGGWVEIASIGLLFNCSSPEVLDSTQYTLVPDAARLYVDHTGERFVEGEFYVRKFTAFVCEDPTMTSDPPQISEADLEKMDVVLLYMYVAFTCIWTFV